MGSRGWGSGGWRDGGTMYREARGPGILVGNREKEIHFGKKWS